MAVLRKRGRPKGTKKREHAEAAARAIAKGEFNDIGLAAIAFFHLHAGGRPRETIAVGEKERFRDFVAYVEESYKDMIRDGAVHKYGVVRGLRRTFMPLANRNRNRRVQPNRVNSSARKLKRELEEMSINSLRYALAEISDDTN